MYLVADIHVHGPAEVIPVTLQTPATHPVAVRLTRVGSHVFLHKTAHGLLHLLFSTEKLLCQNSLLPKKVSYLFKYKVPEEEVTLQVAPQDVSRQVLQQVAREVASRVSLRPERRTWRPQPRPRRDCTSASC